MRTTSVLFSSILSSFTTPAASSVETAAFFSPIASSPARVETVSGWRKQARAEEAAGLSDSRNTILISDLLCDICTIGVGRNHYERELYLYPIGPGDRECIGDTTTTFTQHKFLQVCGGCAHRRHLSPDLLMLTEDYFQTNALFCMPGETVRELDFSSELEMLRAKRALREHITRFTRSATARRFPAAIEAAPAVHKPSKTSKPKPARRATQIYHHQQHEERRQAVAL